LEQRSPEAQQAAMYQANPVFIARNHLVEAAITAATDKGDFAPFNTLVERLSNPWHWEAKDRALALPPEAGQQVYKTFCGT
ncbi:MAG: hypothetical protein NWQ24_03155, partial [Haliea sp.]|nr:hypothetical protein [Haliea sp.]